MCHCRRGTNPGWPRHLLCNHGLLSLSGAGAHSCNPVRSYSQALVTDRCRLGSNSALAPAMLAATLTASARAAPQRAGLRRAAAVAGPARCRRPARSGFDINHPTATSFKRCQVTRAQAVQAVGSTAQQQPTPTAGVADQLQSMPQAFAWAAQQWGDAPAIEDRHRQPHTKLNFRQLHDQITCFAAGLSALGVRPGDRQVPHGGWQGMWRRFVAAHAARCCHACPTPCCPVPCWQGGTVQREQRPLGGSRPGKRGRELGWSWCSLLRFGGWPPPRNPWGIVFSLSMDQLCRASKRQGRWTAFAAPSPSLQASAGAGLFSPGGELCLPCRLPLLSWHRAS